MSSTGLIQPTNNKECKCTVLALLASMDIKMCPDCKTKYAWYLDPGQKPLITSSRDKAYGN